MQKISLLVILLGVITFGVFLSVSEVGAQGYCATDWVCTCSDMDYVTGTCRVDWDCVCPGTSTCNCPSGQFCLPDGSCRDVGSTDPCTCGVRADGSCRSCPSGCPWTPVNCPVGYTVAYNQPQSTFCAQVTYCPAPGNAQVRTGCCYGGCDPVNENDCWCSSMELTTYACCPPNTVDSCTDVVSGTYVMHGVNCHTIGSCVDACGGWANTACIKSCTTNMLVYGGLDPVDSVINYWSSASEGICYCSGEDNGQICGRDCCGGRAWVYNYAVEIRNVTRTCSCVPIPTCSLSLSPIPVTAPVGSTAPITASFTETGGTVNNVRFTLPNTTYASFVGGGTWLNDNTRADGFSALVAGVAAGGPVTITATATMNSGTTCVATAPVVVVNANTFSWWQVGSGDVHAGDAIGGVIKSLIPTGVPQRVLIKNNTAGFSGVASTASSTSAAIDLGTSGGQVSSPANWKATGSPFVGTTEGYSYNYFDRKIPDGCTPTPLTGSTISTSSLASGGATGGACGDYYWYKYDSPIALTLSGNVDLGNRKVILFVKGGNITLNGDINFVDGVGAFYLFSEANILISPTVGDAGSAVSTPDIEGILFSQGTILTGTVGSATDLQLHVRGGVVGLGGVTLQRNLSNNNLYPAEYFEFGPDLILSWPQALSRRTLQWREVAP